MSEGKDAAEITPKRQIPNVKVWAPKKRRGEIYETQETIKTCSQDMFSDFTSQDTPIKKRKQRNYYSNPIIEYDDYKNMSVDEILETEISTCNVDEEEQQKFGFWDGYDREAKWIYATEQDRKEAAIAYVQWVEGTQRDQWTPEQYATKVRETENSRGISPMHSMDKNNDEIEEIDSDETTIDEEEISEETIQHLITAPIIKKDEWAGIIEDSQPDNINYDEYSDKFKNMLCKNYCKTNQPDPRVDPQILL